jgi:hypothetical protein
MGGGAVDTTGGTGFLGNTGPAWPTIPVRWIWLMATTNTAATLNVPVCRATGPLPGRAGPDPDGVLARTR